MIDFHGTATEKGPIQRQRHRRPALVLELDEAVARRVALIAPQTHETNGAADPEVRPKLLRRHLGA